MRALCNDKACDFVLGLRVFSRGRKPLRPGPYSREQVSSLELHPKSLQILSRARTTPRPPEKYINGQIWFRAQIVPYWVSCTDCPDVHTHTSLEPRSSYLSIFLRRRVVASYKFTTPRSSPRSATAIIRRLGVTAIAVMPSELRGWPACVTVAMAVTK